MKLIKLSCRCHVNPTDIAEVKMSEYGHITVRMRDGVGHSVDKEYGEPDYKAYDRIINEINAAMKDD